MFRSMTVLVVSALLVAAPAVAKDKKKKHQFHGCPAGLTFAPDLLKKISWARGVWGFPGRGYRPPKEWKCKS